MPVVEKMARDLVLGDVILNNGSVIYQIVPCGNGRSIYLQVIFPDDGYRQCVTVATDLMIATWIEGSDGICQ